MLNSLPVCIGAAAALGFLSGLGTGGGSLLILWLTAIAGMPPETARMVNLLFFLPSALITCFFRRRQGKLDLKKVLPAILTGCAAAGGASWLAACLPGEKLKKLFSVLLLAAGARELLYRPRKAR